MKTSIAQILKIVLLTVTGGAGAVIVGLLVYGSNVFNTGSPGFSFVSLGLSGALVFAFYHVRGLSESITAAVVISTIQFLVSASYITMLHAILFSFGLNLPAIVIAFVFERKLATLKQAKFVVVALTYGGMFVLLTLLGDVLAGSAGLPPEVFRSNFLDGLLLGTGLGLGIEAGESFLHSLEHHAVHR
jgi:hypothetical protein